MNSIKVKCHGCCREFCKHTEHAHFIEVTGLCFSCRKILTEDDVRNVLIHIAKETQRIHEGI